MWLFVYLCFASLVLIRGVAESLVRASQACLECVCTVNHSCPQRVRIEVNVFDVHAVSNLLYLGNGHQLAC